MENEIYKYATKDERGWNEAYDSPHVFASGMLCGKNETIYELELFEVGESDDWDFVGWRDFRFNDDKESDDGISLVWPNFRAFDMCFTYGVEAEVEAERGEIVYLVLNDYTELGTAADM